MSELKNEVFKWIDSVKWIKLPSTLSIIWPSHNVILRHDPPHDDSAKQGQGKIWSGFSNLCQINRCLTFLNIHVFIEYNVSGFSKCFI